MCVRRFWFVCMYICMYCIHMCVYVCVYVDMYIHTYIHVLLTSDILKSSKKKKLVSYYHGRMSEDISSHRMSWRNRIHTKF